METETSTTAASGPGCALSLCDAETSAAAASEPACTRNVRLVLSNAEMVVPLRVTKLSSLLNDMTADDDAETIEVPLPSCDSEKVLARAMEYCAHHTMPGNPTPTIEAPLRSSDMRTVLGERFAWDATFIDEVGSDIEVLMQLILLSNYLGIDSLLDLSAAKFASLLRGKTVPEVREFFGIKEPTPEEEETVRKENQWIFDLRPLEGEV